MFNYGHHGFRVLCYCHLDPEKKNVKSKQYPVLPSICNQTYGTIIIAATVINKFCK